MQFLPRSIGVHKVGAEPQSSLLGIPVLCSFCPFLSLLLFFFYLLGGLEDTCMTVSLVQAFIFKWSQFQDQKVNYSDFIEQKHLLRDGFPMRAKKELIRNTMTEKQPCQKNWAHLHVGVSRFAVKESHSIYPFMALLDLFRFYFLVALEKCFSSQEICT